MDPIPITREEFRQLFYFQVPLGATAVTVWDGRTGPQEYVFIDEPVSTDDSLKWLEDLYTLNDARQNQD